MEDHTGKLATDLQRVHTGVLMHYVCEQCQSQVGAGGVPEEENLEMEVIRWVLPAGRTSYEAGLTSSAFLSSVWRR